MRNFLAIALIFLLSACVSEEERAAAAAAEEIRQCNELGYKEKTRAFADCRLKIREIEALDRQSRATNYLATRPVMGRRCGAYGTSICY